MLGGENQRGGERLVGRGPQTQWKQGEERHVAVPLGQ